MKTLVLCTFIHFEHNLLFYWASFIHFKQNPLFCEIHPFTSNRNPYSVRFIHSLQTEPPVLSVCSFIHLQHNPLLSSPVGEKQLLSEYLTLWPRPSTFRPPHLRLHDGLQRHPHLELPSPGERGPEFQMESPVTLTRGNMSRRLNASRC